MTIYSLDILLSWFGTSLLFHVYFWLLLPDLHTDFSGGRSGGLVCPSLKEFSVCCYPNKGFNIVSKAEVDVFLELCCFSNDPVDVDNLISGSSAFSKSSLNIWKFTIHVLLKTWRILSITLLACEMSAIVPYFEHSLVLPFFGLEWKLTFSSPVATAEFSKFSDMETAFQYNCGHLITVLTFEKEGWTLSSCGLV